MALRSQAHQFPHDSVAHLDAPHQHQHIEDEFSNVVPDDSGRRHAVIIDGRRGRSERGENHAGENNHTALQTNRGVVLQERNADIAGGLARETGQRNRRNRGCHVEFEKPGIDCQNHHQRENPDKQGTQ